MVVRCNDGYCALWKDGYCSSDFIEIHDGECDSKETCDEED